MRSPLAVDGSGSIPSSSAGTNASDLARPAVLRVEGICLEFGGIRALQDVSFEIPRGRISSIIGPNGAGKTSMLNVVSGVYLPSKGRIFFEGRDRTRAHPEAMARLGIARTFQHAVLFKEMTVLENVMVGRHSQMRAGPLACGFALPGARREEEMHTAQVQDVLEFLEIADIANVEADTLPYGLQKRVELGRALVMRPKLLLLDEPMAGMNAEEKIEMIRFIEAAIAEFGTTVLLIEHDMGVVMNISELVVVLDYGRKIAQGAPSAIRTNPAVIRAYLGEDA